jgi:hypothetical protein
VISKKKYLRNEKKSQMASRKWRFSWSNKYAVPINIYTKKKQTKGVIKRKNND